MRGKDIFQLVNENSLLVNLQWKNCQHLLQCFNVGETKDSSLSCVVRKSKHVGCSLHYGQRSSSLQVFAKSLHSLFWTKPFKLLTSSNLDLFNLDFSRMLVWWWVQTIHTFYTIPMFFDFFEERFWWKKETRFFLHDEVWWLKAHFLSVLFDKLSLLWQSKLWKGVLDWCPIVNKYNSNEKITRNVGHAERPEIGTAALLLNICKQWIWRGEKQWNYKWF